jgi:2-amino-4-hydroxy-6-hydroxymethyldihydropteridine diphosphokinase
VTVPALPRDALLALGSNIDPEAHVPRGLALLRARFDVRAVSCRYRSAAVGGPPGAYPAFVNLAVRVRTALPPRALREACRRIEERCGRQRSDDRNAPRTLDVDVVWMAGVEGRFGPLVLPDPELARRAHVLVPCAEVGPEIALPGAAGTLSQLAAALSEAARRRLLRVGSGEGP